MKALVFLKKEIKFYLSPVRLCTVPLIFLLFALTSPVLARYTQEIIAAVDPTLKSLVPPPVLADAFAQFAKNLSQMGFLLVIVIFSGVIVKEKEQGTAVLMLTRPLGRGTFILMKFAGAFLYYTVSSLIASLAFLLYTDLMFGGLGFAPFAALFCIYLYGLVLVFFTLLLSALCKSAIPAAVGGIVAFLGLGILSAVPKLGAFLPTKLAEYTVTFASKAVPMADFAKPFVVSLLLLVLCPVLTVMSFKRQEL